MFFTEKLEQLVDFSTGWLLPDMPKQDTGTEYTMQKPDKLQHVYGENKGIKGQIVRSFVINEDKNIPNNILVLQVQWSVGACHQIPQVYLNERTPEDDQFKLKIRGKNFNSPFSDEITALNLNHACKVWNRPDGGVFTESILSSYNIDGHGHAYSVIMLFWHQTAMPSLPNITADVNGRLIKNLETDVVEYIDNYADIIYDFMTDQYGGRLPESILNKPSFIEERIFTKSLKTRYSGDTVKQKLMSCHVVLDGNQLPEENINILRQGCRGFIPFHEGQYHLLVEKERTPESFEITDDNILGDFIVNDMPIDKRYNQAIVKFKDKEQKGKESTIKFPEDGSALLTQYKAEDSGISLPVEVTLDTVNNEYEAIQAAEIIVKRSRNGSVVKTKTKREGDSLVVGKVVNASNSAFGMAQKPFIVTNKTNDEGVISLEMIEYQPSIYPWTEKPQQVIPDSSIPSNATVSDVTGLTVSFPNDGINQVTAQWTSTESSFEIWLNNDLISTTSVNSYSFNNLPLGNYTLTVVSLNGLGYRSTGVTAAVNVNPPANVTNITFSASGIVFWDHPNSSETKEFLVTVSTTDTEIEWEETTYVKPSSEMVAGNYQYQYRIPVEVSGDYTVVIKSVGKNNLASSGTSGTLSFSVDATVITTAKYYTNIFPADLTLSDIADRSDSGGNPVM